MMPDLIVELSTAPPADTPVWEDITADVMEVTTKRGRQQELDRYRAGTCTISLDNSDATYDPTNTGSPLHGFVKPMRRIRIQATWDAVTYPIFDGYIDSVEQSYAGPQFAKATIRATDAFKVLAGQELPPSAYAAEVAGAGPVHWWRLDENVGATVALDAIADADAAVQGAAAMGAPTLISRDPGAAMTGAAIGDNIRIPAGAGPTGTGGFTVEFVIDTDAMPSSRGRVLGTVGDDTFEVGIGANALGVAPPYMWVGESTVIGNYTAASNVSNNEFAVTQPGPVHVAAVREAAGLLRLYVDGVNITGTITGVGPDELPPQELDFGTQRLNVEDVIAGTFDELAIYDRALTAAEVAAHAAEVTTPWNNDLPGERIERVLDLAGWPAADRDIDAGVTVLQSATLETNALAHAQAVADTEFGALFITADGTVRFIDREGLKNRPELYTFSDDPVGAGELPYTGLRPEYSDALIRNEVTVSRAEGVAQTVRNDASVAEYMVRSYVIDGLLHDDDEHSRYAAQWIASAYAEPVRRITNLTIAPQEADHTAELFEAVLTLELADEVTAVERPPGGITITQESAVEGIAHTIRPGFWSTAFNLSPVAGGATTGAVWQLDTAGASELGVTTRLGF